MYGIVSAKVDLTHVFFFQDLNFGYSRSLKCPLHIAFYALRIGVFVSHTFQHKHCIFIAGTGNLIIYGTVSAKIAPRLKCYKNASRLNRYNFRAENAIDFLFSTLHSEMV